MFENKKKQLCQNMFIILIIVVQNSTIRYCTLVLTNNNKKINNYINHKKAVITNMTYCASYKSIKYYLKQKKI